MGAILFFAGLGIGLTHALAPLHEFGHLIFGGGEIVSWTQTRMTDLTLLSALGGFLAEGTVFLLWTLLAALYRRGMLFPLGYLHALPWQVYRSSDFRVLLPRLGYPVSLSLPAALTLLTVLLLLLWLLYLAQRHHDASVPNFHRE